MPVSGFSRAKTAEAVISRRKSKFYQKFDYPLYLLVLGLTRVFCLLPLSWVLGIGAGLGKLFYLVSRCRRQICLGNLKLAFGRTKNDGELRRIAKENFANLGRSMAEFCRLPKINKDNITQYVTYEGLENFQSAVRQKKGVLFLAAHFGNWELLAYGHGFMVSPAHIVDRPLDNEYLDRLVHNYRGGSGNKFIPKKGALRPILNALKENQQVGILIDQNVSRDEGVFVDFFDMPACTTPGPAYLALRTGVPVVFGFIIRQPGGRHRVVYEKPFQLIRTGNSDRDVQLNTQQFTKLLEDYVRRYPEQWFWLHRRWKTQPKSAPQVMPERKIAG